MFALPFRCCNETARRERAFGDGGVRVKLDPKEALALWRSVTLASMTRGQPDLTTRQMAVLMQVYLAEPPHTIRGLSALLKISKPATTRAVDRLATLGYLRRKPDETDRRSILIQRTVAGSVFLREFGDLAAKEAAGV